MSKDKSEMWAYYWRLFASDAPAPVAELEFDKCLKRRHRFDWAWPKYRIAVEIDGGQWSARGGRHAGDADREKGNIAAFLGWRVFHFSPDQLTCDPEKCVEMVKLALLDSA